MIKSILILILLITFSKVSIASDDVLNDANLYTVKLKTSIDRPFREDRVAGLRKGSSFLVDKKRINNNKCSCN